jgi:hypothetical protein
MTGLHRLPDRAVLSVRGPDAQRFLDNLLTQDLDHLSLGACAYAALLSPQGKILSDLFVWRREGEAFLLDAPASRAALLAARLRMFKLRAQVEIEEAPQWRAVLVEPGSGAAELQAPDPRLAALGLRGLAQADAPAADPAELLAQRVRLGVPDLAADAEPEQVFALEGLLEELKGVSFKKGCFPGQENVSRMKRRATTRKKFCRVALAGAVSAGAGVRAGAAELGEVRAVSGAAGLALLRLDRALEAAAQGQTLDAEGVALQLDPPAWLLLPSPQEQEA